MLLRERAESLVDGPCVGPRSDARRPRPADRGPRGDRSGQAAASRLALAAWRAAGRALRRCPAVPTPVREELAQEAFLRTWTAVGVRDARAYAAATALRLAVDWLRRERRTTHGADLSEVAEVACWQDRAEASLDLRRVEATVAAGPATHRATLVALCWEERTVEELVGSGRGWRRRRDALYKRRRRAAAWIGRVLGWRGRSTAKP